VNKDKSWLEEQLSDPELAREVAREDLILEITERLSEYMAKHGLGREDLAKTLGKPVGFVTELLGGGRRLTLGAIAEVIRVLGAEAEIKIQPVQVKQLDGIADGFRQEAVTEAGGLGWRDEPVKKLVRRPRPRGEGFDTIDLAKSVFKSAV